MKKWKPVAIVLIALLFTMSLVSSAIAKPHGHMPDQVRDHVKEFSDLDEAEWATPYILRLTDQQVFAGYEDGTFRPNKPVTRVEALATAVRLMGLDDEAAKVDSTTELHFKDADLIDERFAWAKGSIVVGLENGLFEPSEEVFDPHKPATRAWVAALMVRALGLEDEALERMTEVPKFNDAETIPAGSIGYVNVAVAEEIVTGYTNNTFQPNNNVTRAEIAVLLAKTGDLIDEEQADQIVGKVTALKFGQEYEAGEGDSATDGVLIVDTYTGEREQFAISSNLYVDYKNEYFRAEQLRPGDIVEMTVKNDRVIGAALLSSEDINEQIAAVQKLEIEVEQDADTEYKIKYKSKKGKVSAKVERKTKNGKEKLEKEEAKQALEALLHTLALTPDMDEQQVTERVFVALDLDRTSFIEVEIEVSFANGKKVKIEHKRNHEDEGLHDRNDRATIKEMELEVEFYNDDELEIEYKNGHKAEVEHKQGQDQFKLKSTEAAKWIEQHLDLPQFEQEIDREALLNDALASFDRSLSDVKEVELEVKFTNGKKYEWEWKPNKK